MREDLMMKVNEYKFKGFDITLAKHPEDKERLFVVAVKGDHVLRLFAEPVAEAVEYVRKSREQ